MKPDDMERRIIEAARDYNEPPDPPREELWAGIREHIGAADGGGAPEAGLDRPRSSPVRRLPRWTPWATGLAAAMLAVGFGLGRFTEGVAPSPAPAPAASADRQQMATTSLPVRMVAADHLGEAEALLTFYRSAEGSQDRLDTAGWARDLLATTRMLMDSRAGQDPEMAQLLADLELVLVQIAGAAADSNEQELIEHGIQEQQLMVKLRSASDPIRVSL